MDSHNSALLESVTGNKKTPLKEITDVKLREKNMLVKQLGPLLNIKESQVKRILAGESGTRPDSINQFQNFLDITPEIWTFFWDSETNRARTFEDFSAKRESALHSEQDVTPDVREDTQETKSTPISTMTPTKIVLGAIAACGALAAIVGLTTNSNQPPTASNTQGPCLVELRETTPPSFSCDGIGAFAVTGSTLEKWNTKTSLIYIPEEWEVIARYETWGGQNYSVLQEDKSGFVKLHSGFNHLDSDTYDVFKAEAFDGRARRSAERELNDRIQYLIVTKALNGEAIKIWEHDEKSDQNQIQVLLSPL